MTRFFTVPGDWDFERADADVKRQGIGQVAQTETYTNEMAYRIMKDGVAAANTAFHIKVSNIRFIAGPGGNPTKSAEKDFEQDITTGADGVARISILSYQAPPLYLAHTTITKDAKVIYDGDNILTTSPASPIDVEMNPKKPFSVASLPWAWIGAGILVIGGGVLLLTKKSPHSALGRVWK